MLGDREEPTLISKSIDYNVSKISAGKEHVLLLLNERKIYSWG